MAFLIIGLIVIGVVVLYLLSGLTVVPQAETRVIERLGRYNRTLNSGLNLVLPWFEKSRRIYWRYVQQIPGLPAPQVIYKETTKIDLRETVFDFPSQQVITKDNVILRIDALLYYQIVIPTKAVYEIANLPDAIEKLTLTTLRNLIGELDLDETLISRDTINSQLRAILDDATEKWGVKVNRVELQDITPPPDIRQVMEKQMTAERERRAKILQAEGDKSAAILSAEGMKQAAINKSEGEREASILKAEGEAEARRLVAAAEAEAVKKVTEALAKTPSNASNYMIAIRYIEALKEMVSGKDNKVVYLPYEATGILSSIGGIKEMLTGIEKKTK